jgi:transcriptional regulator
MPDPGCAARCGRSAEGIGNLFVPDTYRIRNVAVARALMEEIRTGTLLTAPVFPDPFPDASHLPFLVDSRNADPEDGRGMVLTGHVDRRNRQWEALESLPHCRVSFLGPQCHVSPSWYGNRPRAPTWLYVAVVLAGRATLVTDERALRHMVETLSDLLEPAGSGWHSAQVVPYTERLMRHIVGFEIVAERVDVQLRLGQGNTLPDRRRVLAALRGGDADARRVAALIDRFVPLPGAEETPP